jgi:hypothetical protein
MSKKTIILTLGFLVGTALLPAATAQQVNDLLGSPSATTTIAGTQLPPPPRNSAA